MRRTPKFFTHPFLIEIEKENLNRLLNAVAFNNLPRADKLAQLHPHLLLKSTSITDGAKRNFVNATPLQVAAFHLNTAMCTTLVPYLPNDAAITQLSTDSVDYTSSKFPGYFIEKHFNFNPLLKALENLIHAYQCNSMAEEALMRVEYEKSLLPPQIAMLFSPKRETGFSPLHATTNDFSRLKKIAFETNIQQGIFCGEIFASVPRMHP